jgi:transposase-like protein
MSQELVNKLLAIGIKGRRLEIEEQIETLEDELGTLQSTCPHPNVDKKYHSSSGNYDPGCDREWYSYVCPDCDKRWTEEKE